MGSQGKKRIYHGDTEDTAKAIFKVVYEENTNEMDYKIKPARTLCRRGKFIGSIISRDNEGVRRRRGRKRRSRSHPQNASSNRCFLKRSCSVYYNDLKELSR